ncbi:MAG: nucleotide exchange factor GrpE [Saprospiraceae bacterium]|nr:nucleotide exchange factor GrpE [Saprospiraceae bacterium]
MTMDHLTDEKEEMNELEDVQQETVDIEENKGQSDEIADLKAQVEESKDKYLRLFAEFDNYRKRTMKEALDVRQTAAKDTIISLLPVLDDFERAKKLSDHENSTEVFSEGVSLVYQKLFSTLEAKGLKAMESNGEVFNPEFHEAITEIPAPNEDMKGKIIDTVERGYFLNGKIIRYAKVVVGK